MYNTFTIYGERCSGTNFLRKLMYDNFKIEYEFLPNELVGFKHWFGHQDNKDAIQNSTSCVILPIVRNPLDTFVSFFKNPHHQSKERLIDFYTFLSTEFYSISQRPPHDELLLDRYQNDGWRRFHDIFEWRSVKSNFLHTTIPSLTPNSYFINYDTLKKSPELVLAKIESKFDLIRKYSEFKVEARRVCPQVSGIDNFDLSDDPPHSMYVIADQICRDLIKSKLNFDIEESMGFDKKSIMERLT